MRKVFMIVGALMLVFSVKSYLDAKMTESDTNREIAYEFLREVCGRDSQCLQRMEWFKPCFAGAYRVSPFKGGDRVNVEALVECMNGSLTADVFVLGEGNPVPFPME